MTNKIQKAKLSKHLDPLSHIRQKPGMYIGHTQNPIIITREIIDNALDEVMAGGATNIWVTIHNDDSISVRDNGRGMPVDVIDIDGQKMPNARASWTIPNTGSHLDTDITSTSSGTHGVGSKATLATSDRFTGEIWLNQKYYRDEYIFDTETNKPGKAITPLKDNFEFKAQAQTPDNTPADFTHGTRVRFYPSQDVFETIKLDWEWLKKHMHQQAYLHPELTVILYNEPHDETIKYHEAQGLKAYAKELVDQNDGVLITQLHQINGQIKTDTTMLEAEIVFGWTNSRNINEVGFTNSIHNHQGGTHVDGFNNGITKLMNNYATTLNLSKESLTARDIRPGLVAIINLKYSDPMYNGQTKDALTTPEVKTSINKIVLTQGQLELDRYIQDIEAIIKQAVARAEARKAFDDISNIKIDKKHATTKLSQKLAPAKKTGPKVHAELFIVEGDSAGGGLIRTRIQDPVSGLYQAVMPIRGKISNAAKNSPAKVFANEEIGTIIAALGAGYGEKFDESKLNYERLIIATDADADGAQIALLLRMFAFKYLRPLIENGHVFRAMSPLYVNDVKEGSKYKEVYTYTETEQQTLFENHQVKNTQRYKGLGEMNDDLVKKTMIMPGTRRLYQFTVDDFDKAYTNAELFEGPDVQSRREFLFENAEFAEVLDAE